MPRSPDELAEELRVLEGSRPLEGWPHGEEYRRQVTLEHGGDPDDLACAICGVKVKHEKARIIIGLIDRDFAESRIEQGLDPDGTALPPLAFCQKHSGDDVVLSLARHPMGVSVAGYTAPPMPSRAREIYSKLRQK